MTTSHLVTILLCKPVYANDGIMRSARKTPRNEARGGERVNGPRQSLFDPTTGRGVGVTEADSARRLFWTRVIGDRAPEDRGDDGKNDTSRTPGTYRNLSEPQRELLRDRIGVSTGRFV